MSSGSKLCWRVVKNSRTPNPKPYGLDKLMNDVMSYAMYLGIMWLWQPRWCVLVLESAVELNAKMNYSHCISRCRIEPVY